VNIGGHHVNQSKEAHRDAAAAAVTLVLAATSPRRDPTDPRFRGEGTLK